MRRLASELELLTLLGRAGVWLDETHEGFVVRTSPDRRRRAVAVAGAAAVRGLMEADRLTTLPRGGWRLRTGQDDGGRPGMAPSTREVVEGDGRRTARRVNAGESPLAWLARRRDARGQPWLTPAQAAAGERLREAFERAGGGPRVTMRWDAAPGQAGFRPGAMTSGDLGVEALRRIEGALAAVGPELRGLVERVCLYGSALEAAERAMGLPRRSGKTLLRLGLQRLAEHYRLV